jgi:hypothetical protein
VTRLEVRRLGVRFVTEARDFSLLKNVQTASGGPLSLLFSGTYGFLPAVQQASCEFDRSLSSIAEFKNEMIYFCSSSVASMRGQRQIYFIL